MKICDVSQTTRTIRSSTVSMLSEYQGTFGVFFSDFPFLVRCVSGPGASSVLALLPWLLVWVARLASCCSGFLLLGGRSGSRVLGAVLRRAASLHQRRGPVASPAGRLEVVGTPRSKSSFQLLRVPNRSSVLVFTRQPAKGPLLFVALSCCCVSFFSRSFAVVSIHDLQVVRTRVRGYF